jgi:hypothetical protein
MKAMIKPVAIRKVDLSGSAIMVATAARQFVGPIANSLLYY